MRNVLLIVATLASIAACQRLNMFGRADDAPAAVAKDAVLQPAQPITRFAVEFTPAAQKLVDADERFNSVDLRDAIVAELGARKLMDQKPGSGRPAVLQVDEFSVRATSNMVILHRVASEGVLGGVIRIRDSAGGNGVELRTLAKIPMKMSTTGTEKKPLKNLYRGFARQLVDELTGSPPVPARQ